MKNNILLLLLSLIHVHLSILTGPVYLMLMLGTCTEELTERDCIVLYGMLVQCTVTIFLGYKLFNFRKIWIWVLSMAICLTLGMALRHSFEKVIGSLPGWNSFFESIYSTSDFAGYVILLYFIQILFLVLYHLTSYIKD